MFSLVKCFIICYRVGPDHTISFFRRRGGTAEPFVSSKTRDACMLTKPPKLPTFSPSNLMYGFCVCVDVAIKQTVETCQRGLSGLARSPDSLRHSFTVLTLEEQGLEDISAIEQYIYLQSVQLRGNRIKSLAPLVLSCRSA